MPSPWHPWSLPLSPQKDGWFLWFGVRKGMLKWASCRFFRDIPTWIHSDANSSNAGLFSWSSHLINLIEHAFFHFSISFVDGEKSLEASDFWSSSIPKNWDCPSMGDAPRNGDGRMIKWWCEWCFSPVEWGVPDFKQTQTCQSKHGTWGMLLPPSLGIPQLMGICKSSHFLWQDKPCFEHGTNQAVIKLIFLGDGISNLIPPKKCTSPT